MKHNYKDLTEFQKWILCQANTEKLSNIENLHGDFSLSIYINDKDVGIDVIQVLSKIEMQLDTMILQEARELLDEKLSKLITTIYNVQQSIDEFLPDYYKN